MGNRKKSGASAAQAAADLYAKTGTTSIPSGNFTFGARFIDQVSPDIETTGALSTSTGSADQHVGPTSLRVQKCLQHLSKSDARTRQRALSSLQEALEEDPSDAGNLLGYWSKQFPKLMKDPSKHVRIGSCELTMTLSTCVGRGMGKIIKDIFPPLFFAQYDENDVALVASRVVQGMLPGGKTDKAIDMCLDQMVSIMKQGMIDQGQQSDDQAYALASQYINAAKAMLRMGHAEISARISAIIQDADFSQTCLHGKHQGIRREAYSLIAAMAMYWSGEPITNSVFIQSVFASLKDQDSQNFLDILTMIIAFGRQFENVWDYVDVEKDFFKPLRRIATIINQKHSLYDVNKSLLPLVALPPREHCRVTDVCSVLKAVWKAHEDSSHHAKSCAIVGTTIKECIEYFINNKRDGSVGEFFTMILGSLDRQPISSCSQVIASSCIRDIGWTEEDTVDLLKELEHHTESMLDEHVLERSGPMLSSLPTSYEFVYWQLCLLRQALQLSESYWVNGKIDFCLSILQNTWRFSMGDKDRGNSSDAFALVQADILKLNLVPELHEKLFKRSLGIHSDELNEIIARSVLLSEDPPAVFHTTVSSLGPRAASELVTLMAGMEDIGGAVMCNLRSSELDDIFIEDLHNAIVAKDTEKKSFCMACVCHRGLVSQDCIKQAAAEILDLMKDQDSIDSKAISLQLLDCIIGYDDSTLDSSNDSQSQILSFTLQTAWEEFLLDLCGDPAVAFDGNWMKIVDHNKTLQAAQHILTAEFSSLSLNSTHLSEWVEGTLTAEIGTNSGHMLESSHHNMTTYCLISYIISLVPEPQKATVLTVFQSILTQFPATAVEILDQSESKIISDLTRDMNGLDLLTQIICNCLDTGISVGPLVAIIVEGQESYASMLQYQATVGDRSVDVMVHLLDTGLASMKDAIQEVAIEFCKSELFNMSAGVWQCRVLTHVGSSIRTNESLLHRSGLSSYTCSLLEKDMNDVSKRHLVALGACLGQYDVACTHGWQPLQPGTPVWYMDTKSGNEWTNSKILSRDDSIHPPSFVVEAGESARETEPSRLRVAQVGVFSLPRPTRKVHLDPIVLYDPEEIIKMTSLIKHISMHDDLFPLDAPGLSFIFRFSVLPSVWEKLLPEERSTVLERMSTVLGRSYSEINAVVGEVSATLVNKVNQVIGTGFGNVSDTVRFMLGLQTNLKLRSVPKIKELYSELEELICDALISYQSSHGETISAANHAFIALLDQDSSFSSKKKLQTERAKISLEIASIFNAMGYFMGVTSSIFGTVSKSFWSQLSNLLESLASAIQAMEQHNQNFTELIGEARSRNTHFDSISCILSLCLNNGISAQASRAAFIIALQSTEVMNTFFFNDSESFYDKIEEIISQPVRRVPEAMPDLLSQCGMIENIANGIHDPLSMDFIPSWCLLICFLTNPNVDSTQKELLVALLKEFNVLTEALLDYIVIALEEAKQDSPRSLGNIAMSRTQGDQSKIHNDIPQYLQYLNNEMNSFVPTDGRVVAPCDVLLVGLLTSLPVACRTWFIDLKDKRSKVFVEDFVKTKISPFLIKEEFKGIDEDDSGNKTLSNFHIKSIDAKNQILASLEVEDGHSIDLKVSFPKEYPLRAPSANLEKYIGISEAKARKWNLSIAAFLMNRNGNVAEVIQTWKKNVSQEFEGHEDCLICYSIIQPSTGQLPRLTCKTCHQKYHGTCLYKWFKTSGKSNCVHCQSPW